jgi:hypothetical protein
VSARSAARGGELPRIALAAFLADRVDSRIAEKSAESSIDVFSVADGPGRVFVRDPDCWLHGLDIIGCNSKHVMNNVFMFNVIGVGYNYTIPFGYFW